MTTVARTVISIPERSATDTWDSIVRLIAPDDRSAARHELAAVAGVACSCITDEALAQDPLVVHGVGPRVRIYALYGDEALDGDTANESPLSHVPTDGDWRMSIPCLRDDLAWVQRALSAGSSRVTARAVGTEVENDSESTRAHDPSPRSGPPTLHVDRDSFFRR